MSPLESVYGQAARARRRWYERHPEARRRLRHPVISVGNLSVGGTGKTPLVTHLAQWLIDHGERPAILSRGYKRRYVVDGVVTVSDGASILSDLDHAGDEPLMLARALPRAIVCVCEDRHLAGVVAERALGATAHLLDDGFQHLHLYRDFDILVTSPGEITDGRVLPAGRLREPRDAAARAQFVVVLDADRDRARTEAWELGISAFTAARRVLGAPGALGALGALGAPGALGALGAPGALGAGIAVAGIGRPEQFFSMVRDAGVELTNTIPFADHHRYTQADVARIRAVLDASGADVVWTTAKDAVRFEPVGPLPFRLGVVPLGLVFDDWEALDTALQDVLARARRVA